MPFYFCTLFYYAFCPVTVFFTHCIEIVIKCMPMNIDHHIWFYQKIMVLVFFKFFGMFKGRRIKIFYKNSCDLTS